MKVLSLCQPFASALIYGHKHFETRGWRPSARMLSIIRKDGFLIHASATKKFMHLVDAPPFVGLNIPYPRGFILGKMQIGRILSTEEWKKGHGSMEPAAFKDIPGYVWTPYERMIPEYMMGDYSENRYAWECLSPVVFETPIFCKGQLSFWNFNLELSL